ncbi:MAG: TIGR02147 family protein, partial [Bdellovibrionota bacterium]
MKAAPDSEKTAIQNPADFLRAAFLERKERNLRYSTRAFARDLGISQALLSLVLSGKRPLTARQAVRIGVLLGLTQGKARELLESALRSLPQKAKSNQRAKASPLFKDYEVERFKAISQWYHVAILDLTTTRDFRNDVRWIALRLGITTIEARDALSRLLDLGFLTQTGNTLKKSDEQIYFLTKKSEVAVRA